MTPQEVTLLKTEITAILPSGIPNSISAAKIRSALFKAIDQLNVVDTTFTWGEVEGNLADQTDLVQYIAQKVAALVDSSPSALNTLNELANALGNDPNFATTVLNGLGVKLEAGDLVPGENITITLNNEGKLVIAGKGGTVNSVGFTLNGQAVPDSSGRVVLPKPEFTNYQPRQINTEYAAGSLVTQDNLLLQAKNIFTTGSNPHAVLPAEAPNWRLVGQFHSKLTITATAEGGDYGNILFQHFNAIEAVINTTGHSVALFQSTDNVIMEGMRCRVRVIRNAPGKLFVMDASGNPVEVPLSDYTSGQVVDHVDLECFTFGVWSVVKPYVVYTDTKARNAVISADALTANRADRSPSGQAVNDLFARRDMVFPKVHQYAYSPGDTTALVFHSIDPAASPFATDPTMQMLHMDIGSDAFATYRMQGSSKWGVASFSGSQYWVSISNTSATAKTVEILMSSAYAGTFRVAGADTVAGGVHSFALPPGKSCTLHWMGGAPSTGAARVVKVTVLGLQVESAGGGSNLSNHYINVQSRLNHNYNPRPDVECCTWRGSKDPGDEADWDYDVWQKLLAPPVRLPIENLTATGFTVPWEAYTGAAEIFVMVRFGSTPVAGYPVALAGSATSHAVTGLAQGTAYTVEVAAKKETLVDGLVTSETSYYTLPETVTTPARVKQTAFMEHWPVVSGANEHLNVHSWIARLGNGTGTTPLTIAVANGAGDATVTTGVNNGALSDTNTATGFIFFSGTKDRAVAYTEKYTISRVGQDIVEVTFATAHSSSAAVTRPIFKIGSVWYAHETGFQQATSLSSFGTYKTVLPVDPAAANWRVFDPLTLVTSGELMALPAGDAVGEGVFIAGQPGDSTYRLDSFGVLTY